jgi:lactate permease
LVVLPALAIYEVSKEAGAFTVFRAGMQNFTPNKVLQVLAVGWVFVSFLQGITGFGVPVAVGAPLLVGLGVKPLTSVLIALLGQAWGNTFGTLGIAWDGLVAQVDFADPLILRNTILWATGMLGLANLLAGLIITGLAGGYSGLKQNFAVVLILGLIQGLGQMWLALLNPMLSNFVIAAVSLAVIFLIGRHPYYRNSAELRDPGEQHAAAAERSTGMNIHQAFLPYYFLVFSAVFVLLNGGIKSYLGQWKLGLAFVGKTTELGFVTKSTALYSPLAPLIHSGAFLLLAAVVGFGFYQRLGFIQPGGLGRIAYNSWQKTVPSAIAVIGLIAMSKVMDETGQTAILAQGVATVTGTIYPVLAPFIGLLGSFMTSSNLSSNILFGGFQQSVAQILKVDKAPILAAQTVGAAIGSIIAPSKVLLGTTMAGILGQEGDVIRRFFGGAMLLCAIFGVGILAALRLGW